METNEDFWNWFKANEKHFFKTVKQRSNIESDFLDQLSPKLNELKEGYFFLTGMYNDDTVELIITPDGNVKNVVFVEELVRSAPTIKGWKFTALKPSQDIKDVSIKMGGYIFDDDKLTFFAIDNPNFPDEIDIVIVHEDLNDENRSAIINGTYLFLDNYLGELNFIEIIDNLEFQDKASTENTLIPIGKLKDFIIWRQKEFIEKYNEIRTNTESDEYSMIEADLKSGHTLFAVINTDLLQWDSKASHPWILSIEIKFDEDSEDSIYDWLNDLEEEMLETLIDEEGYLYIGRQTVNNIRDIYWACKDFRKPSLVANKLVENHGDTVEISYELYKDKYWQSFDRFNENS